MKRVRDSRYGPSGELRKQITWFDRKRLRQLDDVFKGHIPLAALDTADVIAMQSGALGQLLLGIASLVAQLPQPCAKSRLNRAWGHIFMLEG